MDTLVLNADFQPLSILPLSVIGWELAIKLVALEKVAIVKEYDNWEVHSPSITMKVPSIVATTDYIKWKKDVKYSRNNVLLRDDFTCQICEKEFPTRELTLDHVLPRSFGGKTSWTNIVAACKHCNSVKGNDKRIKPKKDPYKPTYWQLASLRQNRPVFIREVDWKLYLPWDDSLVYVKPRKGKSIPYTEIIGENV